MLPIFPPMEQSSLGVAAHVGEARIFSILAEVDAILLAEGATVAGTAEKSKVNPSPVRTVRGSRMHFFQLIMNPAFMEVLRMTSREEIAWLKEGLAPRPSST